jgi:hypothetical protein
VVEGRWNCKLWKGNRLWRRWNTIQIQRGTEGLRTVIEVTRPLDNSDPIWRLVGIGDSGETGVSANHDRHLADGEVNRWKR